ncbi:hypothetical protein A4S05_02655 [Nostoc sp. KVJ20]|uniref:NHLP leader peptide family RiPP precursor n=1 Tax=Nostoc sp. KVJ20 TaxID=457944 RepID=UPI00083D7749|nr:NHLP leader peptide family RiPP precursor [Nostoc sp. KVJ20]ODH02061.1 hypothetical protein A4S05_02655 [Nostoc sp. KVJ20]
MTANSEEFNVEEFKNSLISKAIEDPTYKERLLSDTKAVVEEELGTNLPEDLTIQAVQQSQKRLYLLLPVKIDDEVHDEILSDEELDAVAGGYTKKIWKGIGQATVRISKAL